MCWSLPLGFVLWPPANGLCWPLWPHHIHKTGQSERCFNALPSATFIVQGHNGQTANEQQHCVKQHK